MFIYLPASYYTAANAVAHVAAYTVAHVVDCATAAYIKIVYQIIALFSTKITKKRIPAHRVTHRCYFAKYPQLAASTSASPTL